MRLNAFAKRCAKEMWRDPLSFAFGIGFPVVLITLMSLLTRNIPEMSVQVFGIESFAPSMAVFGLSFLMIFLGTIVPGDRASSFLMRMFASPLRASDYILGYALPALPIGIVQAVVCLGYAMIFGLEPKAELLVCLLTLVPSALLFISMGLLLGTVLPTPAAVGGISSLFINVCAWMSGTWFPLEMMGKGFRTVCELLPFAHAVNAAKYAAAGDYSSIPAELLWVLGYTTVLFAAAAIIFRRRMKG